MARVNYGALLENIVVVEATRLGLDHAVDDAAVALADAFPMPPLPQRWCKEADAKNSPDCDHAFLLGLTEREQPPEAIQDHWARCTRNPPALPTSRFRDPEQSFHLYPEAGPNGALIASMLCVQRGREIHLWVNDDGGIYGEVPPDVPSSESELR